MRFSCGFFINCKVQNYVGKVDTISIFVEAVIANDKIYVAVHHRSGKAYLRIEGHTNVFACVDNNVFIGFCVPSDVIVARHSICNVVSAFAILQGRNGKAFRDVVCVQSNGRFQGFYRGSASYVDGNRRVCFCFHVKLDNCACFYVDRNCTCLA